MIFTIEEELLFVCVPPLLCGQLGVHLKRALQFFARRKSFLAEREKLSRVSAKEQRAES